MNDAGPAAHPHTILVVEYQPPLRGLLTETLEAAGYLVAEAWNGVQAIEWLEQHAASADQLCLILLDMLLPYVSGLQVLEYLTAQGIQVAVIAISGHPDLLAAAASAGAPATLAKPLELADLLTLIGHYCPPPDTG